MGGGAPWFEPCTCGGLPDTQQQPAANEACIEACIACTRVHTPLFANTLDNIPAVVFSSPTQLLRVHLSPHPTPPPRARALSLSLSLSLSSLSLLCPSLSLFLSVFGDPEVPGKHAEGIQPLMISEVQLLLERRKRMMEDDGTVDDGFGDTLEKTLEYGSVLQYEL